MIRWKILRLSINSLLGVILMWSCSDKKTDSGQDIFLEFSERKEINVGITGLNSDYLSSLSWLSSNQGLVYNYINHSLDTLLINSDSILFRKGNSMSFEGPYSVSRFFSFFTVKDSILFFSNKEWIIMDIETGETKKFRLEDYPIFDPENPFQGITFSSSFFLETHWYDRKNNLVYFLVQDSRNKTFDLVEFDLVKNQMEKIPFEFDEEEIRRMTLEVKFQKTIMTPSVLPEIFIHDTRLILSFPYKSEILVYDLNSKDVNKISPRTWSFPQIIEAPAQVAGDKTFEEAMGLIRQEKLKLRFGPITYLESEEVYFRMVKGPAERDIKNFELYLEVFDSDFGKIGEQKISSTNLNFDNRYFLVNDKIALIAKDQPDEDVMYFYYLNIRRSK